MRTFIMYCLNKYITILLAPIYLHFGHYPFVLDLLSIGQELIDTLGIYFLNFILIGALIFYRNFLFFIFNKFFFKNYLINKNNLPFLSYFGFFFKSLNRVGTAVLNKILPLFKSKKNKK